MSEFTFYSFFGICLFALGGIIFTKNLIYAVWALLVVLLCMVTFYAFLGADFVATTQLMIYVGGVLVLLVFGLMFSGKAKTEKPFIPIQNKQNVLSALVAVSVGFILYKEIWQIPLKSTVQSTKPTTTPIAVSLFTKHLFAFEIAGMLLLVALLGATLIAAKQDL